MYFIAQNADWFMNYPPFLAAISGTYGWDNQEGVSLSTYLESLLDPSTFADEIVLTAISFMWGVTISIVYPDDLRVFNIRHHLPLDQVDLIFLYSGLFHYSPIGE